MHDSFFICNFAANFRTTIMIADFSVSNYYSIRSEQTISFVPTADTVLADDYTVEVKPGVRLLKMGVVYGANASGKTKVLNAFETFVYTMLHYPQSKAEGIEVVPFLLDNHSKDEPTHMQMNFYLDGERYNLAVRFNSERILEEKMLVYSTVRPSMLYERTYIPGTDSARVEFGKNLGLGRRDQEIIAGNTLNNCSVLAAFGKSNVYKSRLNVVYRWLDECFSEVLNPSMDLSDFLHKELKNDKDGKLKRFITQFLQKSDFNIHEFHLSSDASSILFSHETLNGIGTLPEQLESHGTLRFMGIAAIMKYLVQDNHFIVIDEIEMSLHYELLSYFLRVYLANNTGTSQLLIATHDINLLNEDFVRRDTIWFTDKNEEAETELVRLSDLGLHKNISPYHAYRQGKLVKLPFTGAIYLDDTKEGKE